MSPFPAQILINFNKTKNMYKRNILFSVMILLPFLISAQTESAITSKFDFIPGEKVIFYDDFTSDALGDFPLQWRTNGSGEIVTINAIDGKWFQMTKTGYYMPDIQEKFSDNYTIEFDLYILSDLGTQIPGVLDIYFLSGNTAIPSLGSQPGNAGLKIKPDYETIVWNNWSEAQDWQGEEGQVNFTFQPGTVYHIAFWVQKQRVRLYVGQQKALDLPRGLQTGYQYNMFRIDDNSDETTPFISNFRVAAGLSDMRNKLITEGKLVSYGIQFDVNSDKLKPESFATIKEIAQVLKDNPTVSIKIIGHTDSDGDDAFNMDLSKRRAAAVKTELTKTWGIDAARLETDGKGESMPVASNDSGINKAKNRRVEFIKL